VDGDLSSLDEEFIAYPDNLTDLLFEYVASHPDAFGDVGQVVLPAVGVEGLIPT
jgi:hypothetical protein